MYVCSDWPTTRCQKCVCMYVHVCTCTYIHTHVHTHIDTAAESIGHIYTHMYTHTYTHSYGIYWTHIYTHVHTHTYTQLRNLLEVAELHNEEHALESASITTNVSQSLESYDQETTTSNSTGQQLSHSHDTITMGAHMASSSSSFLHHKNADEHMDDARAHTQRLLELHGASSSFMRPGTGKPDSDFSGLLTGNTENNVTAIAASASVNNELSRDTSTDRANPGQNQPGILQDPDMSGSRSSENPGHGTAGETGVRNLQALESTLQTQIQTNVSVRLDATGPATDSPGVPGALSRHDQDQSGVRDANARANQDVDRDTEDVGNRTYDLGAERRGNLDVEKDALMQDIMASAIGSSLTARYVCMCMYAYINIYEGTYAGRYGLCDWLRLEWLGMYLCMCMYTYINIYERTYVMACAIGSVLNG
jgi:hypothetical protein